MRTLFFLSILFIIAACHQGQTKKAMETEGLKYTAFYWHLNDLTNEREFYLDRYINIRQNGTYVLMRHGDWKGAPQYFSGLLDNNLLQLIDSTFLKNKYNNDYLVDWENPVVYDGLTFCFDYQLTGEKNKTLQYIPPVAPEKIKAIGLILDSFISNADGIRLDTLDLEKYKNLLKKLSMLYLPPLPLKPPPIRKNQVIFKASQFK